MPRAALEEVHPSILDPLLRIFTRREGIDLPQSAAAAIVDALARRQRAPKRFACAGGVVVELDARRLAIIRAAATDA